MKDTPQQRRILYCRLMEDIKVRLAFISKFLQKKTDLTPALGGQFCYLQLRMSCELLALALLMAHGDIPQIESKKLSKEYNAGDIMSRLFALHNTFYPRPVREIVDESGALEGLEMVESNYLTRVDLIKLYNVSGSYLHAGTTKSLSTQKIIRDSDILDWHNRFIGLLNKHIVTMSSDTTAVYVQMQNGATKKVLMLELASFSKSADWDEFFKTLG